MLCKNLVCAISPPKLDSHFVKEIAVGGKNHQLETIQDPAKMSTSGLPASYDAYIDLRGYNGDPMDRQVMKYAYAMLFVIRHDRLTAATSTGPP